MKPNKIIEIRRRLGLTQTEFGRLFGVSDRAVRYWETGVYRPSEAAERALFKYAKPSDHEIAKVRWVIGDKK